MSATAWVVVAVFGGDDGGEPAGSAATTAPPTTSAGAPTTTASAGTPQLGLATGLHLVVTTGAASLVVSLDTADTAEIQHRGVVATRSDGILVRTGLATVEWRPFPFDRPAVDLGPSSSVVFAAAGAEEAWLTGYEVGGRRDARLVALADGSLVAAVSLPAGSVPVGVASRSLVVAAGGDTFVVDPDGVARRLGDGEPVAVLRGDVLARVCSGAVRCRTVALDAGSGATRELAYLGAEPWTPLGPAHPDGRVLAEIHGADGRTRYGLLGPDGEVPVLPAGLDGRGLADAAWTPDGAALLVGQDGAVHVIDPFGPGGPVESAAFDVTNAGRTQLAVVQPRTED